MSAIADQTTIQARLSSLTRYQIEDLCRVARWDLYDEMVAMDVADASAEAGEPVPFDKGWETVWFVGHKRLQEAMNAAAANNLHTTVLILGDIAGTLDERDVAAAEKVLASVANALHTIDSRRN